MNVRFGAHLVKEGNLWGPSHITEKQMTEKADAFVQDPVVQTILRLTSDDLHLTLRGNDTYDNEVTAQIKRNPKDLPPALQKYTSPVPLFHFDYEALFEPDQVAQAQQVLNQDVLSISGQLAAFDADRLNQRLATEGKAGFGRVAGMEELKARLTRDIIEPFRKREKYAKYGNILPSGFLFVGPPGNGKTFIAERLAEELGIPLRKLEMNKAGSPYIHETSIKIGEFYDEAIANTPCIAFIDEMESFAMKREGLRGDQDYKLEESDVLLRKIQEAADNGVITIGATNIPESMDLAALRKGRMDGIILIDLPDEAGRAQSLRLHTQGRFNNKHVNYKQLAQKTKGFSQADIEALVKATARLAAAEDAPIATRHFQEVLKTMKPSVSGKDLEKYRKFANSQAPKGGLKDSIGFPMPGISA